MPRWIIYNPPEEAPVSEQKVAELLQGLDASFTIRWGFFYTDPYSNLSREGDFVIQGPDGHVLVMEAKGGHPSPNPSTGEWNTADRENPFLQLDREWKGAMERLRNQADQIAAKMPFIDPMMAVHRPELREDSAATQARFQVGYQVGDLAIKLYDPNAQGVVINIKDGFKEAFEKSAKLLEEGEKTIFEAGFRHSNTIAHIWNPSLFLPCD